MISSREILKSTLNHQQSDRIPIDFGSNAVTGIHVFIVEKLREYFGLEKHLIKVIEPYQMLGEIENDLLDAIGVNGILISNQTPQMSCEGSWHAGMAYAMGYMKAALEIVKEENKCF